MPPYSRRSLWDLAAPAGASASRFLADAQARVHMQDLTTGCSLGADLEALRGRSVIISTERQLPTALALVQLDGIARRLVLCTPDLSPEHLLAAMTDAEIDTVVSDATGPATQVAHSADIVACSDRLVAIGGAVDRVVATGGAVDRSVETEWVLFTSGTAGRPKLAVHTLASLVGPLIDGVGAGSPAIWSTFYDVRRYGGLQILLRALVGGGSMVLSNAGESAAAFMRRAGTENVTHISGTPSHWRRALMSAATGGMAPGYVRLSGEACDQAILDNLRQAFPNASIAHAFASTEAGVAFDVRDGQAGFPASLVGQQGAVKLLVEDGSLRIQSSRTASRYLGCNMPSLFDASGFVDTGDLVVLHGDRYHFHGRRGGIINVGGLKVHPEAVEAVINQHPRVHMSRVSARPSPITGAIVVAEIVLNAPGDAPDPGPGHIKGEVLTLCRNKLAAHQVPAMVRLVGSLDIAASGKLVRRHA
jgi:acyl-CoA synthetase (AMP-forming)/AMP-acid ligase II